VSIADRLFARTAETVTLQTRADTAAGGGGVTEAYTSIATAVPAKVVEVGTQQLDSEQIEEGVTHIVTIAEQAVAANTEYVLYGARRMRVQRMRLVGPPDIRFRMILCEEV
jgi:hypothetical protein